MKSENKITLEAPQVKDVVDAISKDFSEVLKKHLAEIDNKQSWLILSRVLNSWYAHHFGFAINFGETKLQLEINASKDAKTKGK